MSEPDTPFSEDNLSAQVRARLLFSRESELDTTDSVFNEKTLTGLINQRATIEKQRNNFLRNLLFCLFGMVFVANGQDIQVPVMSISLSSVPGLNPMLAFGAAISIFFNTTSSITIGSYTGLINQFSMKMSNNNVIDSDIIDASLAPQQLFLKILRVRFNHFHPTHIQPNLTARIIYNSSVFFVILLLIFIYLTAYIYIIYFSLSFIDNSLIGIPTKVICLFTLLLSLYLHAAADWPLKHKVYEGVQLPEN